MVLMYNPASCYRGTTSTGFMDLDVLCVCVCVSVCLSVCMRLLYVHSKVSMQVTACLQLLPKHRRETLLMSLSAIAVAMDLSWPAC